MSLLDLSWEDVLHRHILSKLSFGDLFRLRAVSRDYHALVDDYFYHMHTLDLTPYPSAFSRQAFQVSQFTAFPNSLKIKNKIIKTEAQKMQGDGFE